MSKPKTVLIVDDHPLSLLYAGDLIKYEGYQVLQTAQSNQVLSLACEKHPDVILMDIVMPELNGLQVAHQLKQEPQTRSIPIVLMSATEDLYLRNEALSLGIEDILLKPLDRKFLYTKLKTLTESQTVASKLSANQN